MTSAVFGSRLLNANTILLSKTRKFKTHLRLGDTLIIRIELLNKYKSHKRLNLTGSYINQNSQHFFVDEASVPAPTERSAIQSITLPEGNFTMVDGLQSLIELVRPLGRIRMAVVHPCDAVSLAGMVDARTNGLIEPLMVGPKAKIESAALEAGLDITGINIDDVPHSHAAAERAVELARKGAVEALMKGSLHTEELVSAVLLASAGLRTERRLSHCFLIQTPSYPRPFIITDAAINIAPTLSEKADIVRNAVDLAHVIGVVEPRVAILAALEMVNPNMQSTLDAAALCKMADRGQIKGCLVDGPLAFDNAVSVSAARIKGIVSKVAGQADVLVVPDLESGNMLVKQLEYMGNASIAGILLGAKVPIVLTSRSDSRETRVLSCALAQLIVHNNSSKLS